MSEEHIDIVFDGPPGPESGRFVEVEDAAHCSISVGEWIERDDGYWVLRIPDPRRLSDPIYLECCALREKAEQENGRLREILHLILRPPAGEGE